MQTVQLIINLLFLILVLLLTSMARNILLRADVPLRNYSLTHSLTD